MRNRHESPTKSARRKLPLTLLGVLCALAMISIAAALAKESQPPPKTGQSPPTPSFSQVPPDPSASAVSMFAWASHPATGVDHYQCREENLAWFTCASPLTYTVNTDNDGEHQFAVRAVDATGRTSSEADYAWKVPTHGNRIPFTITGSAGGSLYPGAPPRSIPLRLDNPEHVAIYVTSLTVTVTSGPAGCSPTGNLSLVQSSASGATPVQVPAGGSVTLPAQGISAPTIQLVDLPVNQDACKSGAFGLSYTGSAHS